MIITEIEEYITAIRLIANTIPTKACRILVTGASGLIGSCLVDVLSYANRYCGATYQIYALGRNRERLESRFAYDRTIQICSRNINDPIIIEDLDYIVHAASSADPYSYAKYPVETILTNVIGAKNVLEYCKHKTTRALLTSTFEVYGKKDTELLSEEDFGLIDENQIRSSYPESKRVAELLFRTYHSEYNVDCLIARLPSVYGPQSSRNDNKAHAEFIRKAVANQPIVLKSAGLQKRTYCCVWDVVSALLYLLFNGIAGEAYNIANRESTTTICQLASLIADLTGTSVVYQTPNEEEAKGYSKPQDSVLSPDKINQLGWKARYNLNEGIELTLSIARQLSQQS